MTSSMTQLSCVRGAATLTTVLTLLLAAAPAHADAGASTNAQSRCQIKNATFKAPGGDTYSGGGMSGEERTYVCAYAGGRAVEIGKAGNPEASSEGGVGPAVQRLTFAGETAGVVYTDEEGARELRVIDLTSGRTQFSYSLGGGSPGIPGEVSETGQAEVGTIVVASDGSVAWTEQAAERHGYEVVEHSRGATTVLDDTLSTAAHSLTLSGSTLHWRSYGGVLHSATLD
jgi:hypothetical protein